MSTARSERLRGVVLLLAAMLLFACLDATAKHLSARFPVPMLVWARYSFHLLLMVLLLAPTLGRRLMHSSRPGVQILRALMLVATTGCGIAALKLMPLAETTALAFVSPLLVLVMAGPLLGEKIGVRHVAAVAMGMLGVLLIARPGGSLNATGVVLALGAALFYSIYQILTRQIAALESAVTMVFYTALTGTAVMTIALPWYWSGPMPDAREAVLIAALGLLGGGGHFLLTRAFRLAPASTLSPMLYVQLVWATLLGWILFGQLPDGWASIGMLVISASGLWTALAERGAPMAQDSAGHSADDTHPPPHVAPGKPSGEC